jgi:DHA1 family bicyclomycin/chloramphenicol resistance-like MFS transporter
MAMEQLGHVAGSAAAVIGTSSTLIAVGLGFLIGNAYDGTINPLATGFAVLTTISLLLTRLVRAPK